ncbi:unnamed protein product [Paramecium pentaurelia]|uniref:Uncharacterized protein n=1 Tax=Paramecium pentaurelia TaxID=43138 RepID=A0A8S1U125_9CILI|nr:unnamed protein product [Paramecium pentaurelia]
MSYHYLFKFIIIGDTSVGKSCILYQFLEQKFRVTHEMTVGVEFGAKILDLENKQIKLQIWDTAGQETFKSITRQYYRSAAGAILVYDITKRESFDNVREWIKECQTHGTQDMVIVLVGNKIDLEKQYNIHNINGVKFPNQKDSNQRMKKIYYLLKQVQRIIQILLIHSHKQHNKCQKLYRIVNKRMNYQESELDNLLIKHKINKIVLNHVDVAEIIIKLYIVIAQKLQNQKQMNILSSYLFKYNYFKDLQIKQFIDQDKTHIKIKIIKDYYHKRIKINQFLDQ